MSERTRERFAPTTDETIENKIEKVDQATATGKIEIPEYTMEEFAESLKGHFERMEAAAANLELDELLKEIRDRLSPDQIKKINDILKSKHINMKQQGERLREIYISQIDLIKKLLDSLQTKERK